MMRAPGQRKNRKCSLADAVQGCVLVASWLYPAAVRDSAKNEVVRSTLLDTMGPLYPLWKLLFPKYVTTTECLGRAMLSVAKRGAPKPVLGNRDINTCLPDGS